VAKILKIIMGKKYIYEVAGCTACGACLDECRFKAIKMTEKGAVIEQDRCRLCGMCYDNCPHSAIHKKEVEELFQ